MRRIILIILLFTIGILYFNNNTKTESELNKQCLENLNLEMIGVVKSIDYGKNFHGYGIIILKIINSNIAEYDHRKQQKYYFCTIKNGEAEVYDHTSNTSIGDTLMYNTKRKLSWVIRNGVKSNEGSIAINSNKNYYEYIQMNTILK